MLSVYENIEFHACLFGLNAQQRQIRITCLLDATGLAPLSQRAVKLASAKADLLPRFNIQFLWQIGRIELDSDLPTSNVWLKFH